MTSFNRFCALCRMLFVAALMAVTNLSGAQVASMPAWSTEYIGGRVLGDFLWNGIDGPDVMITSSQRPLLGSMSLLDLANWTCDTNSSRQALKKCATRYIDGARIEIRDIESIGAPKNGLMFGHQFHVQLGSDQQGDVWFLLGANAIPITLPDGSRIEYECLESLIPEIVTPWGDVLEVPRYTHFMGHDCLRYFRRVLPNGKVVWSKSFFARTAGSLRDRSLMAAEDNPIIEFYDIRTSGRDYFGILRTWLTLEDGLDFGSLSVGVNLVDGNLLSRDQRIASIDSQAVVKIYLHTIETLFQSKAIDRVNTSILATPARMGRTVRYLSFSQPRFEDAIRQEFTSKLFK